MNKAELLKENEELKGKLGFLANLSFEYIGEGGKVQRIAWSEGYLEWPSARRINYAEKLAEAYHEACMLIQDERDILQQKNLELMELNKNAQKSSDGHKTNNINALTMMNEQNQSSINRIMILEAQLKALGFDLKELE